MNCYNHPLVPAVGRCSVCHRGVCGDCQVVIQARRFCKEDADIKLRSEARTAALRRRGVPISVAAVVTVFNGVMGLVGGFLLITIGMLAPAASSSSIVTQSVKPYLDLFANVLLFKYDIIMLAGVSIFLVGAIDTAAGYYLWRRSKAAAVAALAAAVVGGGFVSGALVILALAGPFVFLGTALALVKVILIGYGWGHLGRGPVLGR